MTPSDQPRSYFRTLGGAPVPDVTASDMREIDRVAVEEFGLGVLQMMENAGRSLAAHAIEMLRNGRSESITVLAGGGGNGGGGLCCARHLLNRGYAVAFVLDREASALIGPARSQHCVLRASGIRPVPFNQAHDVLARSNLVVDALIGYSLRGAPSGTAAALITMINRAEGSVLSLDLPSGLDATTGAAPGVVVRASRVLTLALPKTGLRSVDCDIYLADIGIPPSVYHAVGIDYAPPFGDEYWVQLGHAAVR